MSEPPHTLAELQRWMQAVITNPAGVSAGIQSEPASAQIAIVPEGAERLITRSRALSALDRLEIYNRAYFARLLECLREEYSALAAALGTDLFDHFALSYLCAHPSQSYTLGKLGARFPEFLAETRPSRAAGEAAAPEWPEFLIDLARVERAINEVFDGPGSESGSLLSAADLQAIALERWPETRLACVPCLRLLVLDYPVNEYFSGIRRGENPPLPQPRVSYLALTRRDYRVQRFPLERAAYELLNALLGDETVGEALARASAASDLPDEELAPRIGDWFRTWSAAGFFETARSN